MPRVSELVADRAETRVPLGIGAVTVSFRPRVITRRWQESIVAAEEAGDIEASLYGPIRDVLISWDLESDSGVPIEMTSEVLADVPKMILQSILVGVLVASRPDFGAMNHNSDLPL